MRRSASRGPPSARPSYANGPLSSTSSRFSFNHLVESPPASPALPALLEKHGSRRALSPTPRTIRRFTRRIFWLFVGSAAIYYALAYAWGYKLARIPYSRLTPQGDLETDKDFVGDDHLPEFPTPVVVSDKEEKPKWTVSIPLGYAFPLKPEEYVEMCSGEDEISQSVAELHGKKWTPPGQRRYYYKDPFFLDVPDADRAGLLMTDKQVKGIEYKARKLHPDRFLVGEEAVKNAPICPSTLVFVLETAKAGLGETLMMLWTAYGLAKIEGRSFFVDDTRWAYGKWTDYFELPPIEECRPPPRHEILPCPHTARHLVVSAATKELAFGGAFHREFEIAKASDVGRKKPIFDMARVGHEALFKLKDEDNSYLQSRLKSLGHKAKNGGMKVGVHVRHGDKHPFEFQYKESYIPLYRYADAVRELFSQAPSANREKSHGHLHGRNTEVTLIATDDPEVYISDEFSKATRAQGLIKLASRKALKTNDEDVKVGMFKKFVESPVGWEGGFFAPMFWSLGLGAEIGGVDKQETLRRETPSEESLRLRGLLARAYLLDLAVISKASDAVVCTVSAMGCRLIAVMMGWEKAVDEKRWRNVDGEFGWIGISW